MPQQIELARPKPFEIGFKASRKGQKILDGDTTPSDINIDIEVTEREWSDLMATYLYRVKRKVTTTQGVFVLSNHNIWVHKNLENFNKEK